MERKVLLKINSSVDSASNALVTALTAPRNGAVSEHLYNLLQEAERALAAAKKEVELNLESSEEEP